MTLLALGLILWIAGPAMLLVLPIAIWEFSFGVYMTVKGFRPTGEMDATYSDVDVRPELVAA